MSWYEHIPWRRIARAVLAALRSIIRPNKPQ